MSRAEERTWIYNFFTLDFLASMDLQVLTGNVIGTSSFRGAGFPEIDFKPNCTHFVYSNIFNQKMKWESVEE